MTVSAKDNRKIDEMFLKIATEVAPFVEKLTHRNSDLKKSVLSSKDMKPRSKCC